MKRYFHSYIQPIKRHTNEKVVAIHMDTAPEFLEMERELERISITLATFSAPTHGVNVQPETIN